MSTKNCWDDDRRGYRFSSSTAILSARRKTVILRGEFDLAGGLESALGWFLRHLNLLILITFAAFIAAIEADGRFQY